MNKAKLSWIRMVATWIVFLLLHFSYETFPNTLFKIIGEEGETTFFHMKMLFFAYVIVAVVDFLIRRKSIPSNSNFFFSRMLIAVAYPWLTITLWFTALALGFHLPEIPWEIIYANITTLLGIYLAVRLEEVLEPVEFRPALKGLVILLFIAAVLSYVAFSLNTPIDFFTTPGG
jgi:hypothetical protein